MENHNENKEFLWNFLLENGIINPKTQKDVISTQKIFEDVYQSTVLQNNGNPLIKQNKTFINNMVVRLSQIKNDVPYSKDEIQKKRHEVMNQKYEGKQQEFSKLINAKRPSEIDFSDKTDDDEVITKFKMDSTLAEREKELEEIMAANSKQEQKTAESWINAGSNAVPQKESNDLLNPPKLAIKGGVEDNLNDIIVEINDKDQDKDKDKDNDQNGNRRVSFNDTVEYENRIDSPIKSHEDFLSKLKHKTANTDNTPNTPNLKSHSHKEDIQNLRNEIDMVKESMKEINDKLQKIIEKT